MYRTYRNYAWMPGTYDMTNTKLTPDRLAVLDSLSDQCLTLPGEFAECGVWLGGSAKVLLKGRPLHLFDTFKGMPDNDDPSGHAEGDFGDTSAVLVKDYLGDPVSVYYHIGKIPETFEGLEDTRYSFVHIDVDLYQSTKDCLDYFLPRMVPGGVMVFDDYGFPDYTESEKKAVDERIKVTSLPTGQAIYIAR
jgi:O-methyltransferase